MRKKFDVVASIGTYQKDGEEKKRYMKCGVVLEGDDGRMSMKLDGIPVTPEWNGWFSLFAEQRQQQQSPPQQGNW